VVLVDPDAIHHTATQGEHALEAAGLPIFQRGQSLVRPIMLELPDARGGKTLSPGLKRLNSASLRDHLAQAAAWRKHDGRRKTLVACAPSAEVADIILSRAGQWQLPPIAGVITTPTLRDDGSVLCEPGYDPATRLYHMPDPTLDLPSIPDRPSRDEAMQALALLTDLLKGFPFVDEVDRSVALSAMLTPLVRGILPAVPLHAFTSPTAGTGKSYLQDVAAALAIGRVCPVIASGRTEEETEKRLVSLLLDAVPMVSIDNCNATLGGDLLCQAVERPIIRCRPLGSSTTVEIESRTTLFANGNALRLRGDMVRRSLICRLDAQMERPETRDFAFDPVQQVIADRGVYVFAALMLLKAYMRCGQRNERLRPFQSYGAWSSTVREALVWLGCTDPADSVEEVRRDDPELGVLKAVLLTWNAVFGDDSVSVATVLQELRRQTDQDDEQVDRMDLRAALLAVSEKHGDVDRDRLGYWLRSVKHRIADNMRFVDGGHERNGTVRWKVVGGQHGNTQRPLTRREYLNSRREINSRRVAFGTWQ
jgi:putative DNA primase/helicase